MTRGTRETTQDVLIGENSMYNPKPRAIRKDAGAGDWLTPNTVYFNALGDSIATTDCFVSNSYSLSDAINYKT